MSSIEDENDAVVRVTMEVDYLIPKYMLADRSLQEVLDNWFKNPRYPLYSHHAARDHCKVGYSEKPLKINVIPMADWIAEIKDKRVAQENDDQELVDRILLGRLGNYSEIIDNRGAELLSIRMFKARFTKKIGYGANDGIAHPARETHYDPNIILNNELPNTWPKDMDTVLWIPNS